MYISEIRYLSIYLSIYLYVGYIYRNDVLTLLNPHPHLWVLSSTWPNNRSSIHKPSPQEMTRSEISFTINILKKSLPPFLYTKELYNHHRC